MPWNEVSIGFFREKEATFREEKRDELEKRLEKVLLDGGMMGLEQVALYGRSVYMLRKPRLVDGRINASYHYFADFGVEHIKYRRDQEQLDVSEVGSPDMRFVAQACHTLMTYYYDGVTCPTEERRPVHNKNMVAWLNYLFKEEYTMPNYNPLSLMDAYHEAKRSLDPFVFTSEFCAILTSDPCGLIECQLVLQGYDEVVSDAQKDYPVSPFKEAESQWKANPSPSFDEFNFFSCIRIMLSTLEAFRTQSSLNTAQQLEYLEKLMLRYYQTDDDIESIFAAFRAEGMEGLLPAWHSYKVSMLAVECIAGVYRKNFWDLWKRWKNIFHQSKRLAREAEPVQPKSTYEIFQRNQNVAFQWHQDDMIPYWAEDSKIDFSDKQEKWFQSLREAHQKLLERDYSDKHAGSWFLDLCQYAQQEYYQVFAFADFYEELLENTQDQRYLALIALYEVMLHTPEIQKAGRSIFKEEPNSSISDSWTEHTRLSLKSRWQWMLPEEKNNSGRRMLRRYVALIANKELRAKVFGF